MSQFDVDTAFGKKALKLMLQCIWSDRSALSQEAIRLLAANGTHAHNTTHTRRRTTHNGEERTVTVTALIDHSFTL